MELILDLLQGAGIAAAIGIRPFLPVLLIGVLATADLGLDFDGTAFAFLEQWPFLLGVVAAVAVLDILNRWLSGKAPVYRPIWIALVALSIVLGALLAAASLADRGHPILPGIVVGIACAALGAFAARALFARVRRRLDADAAGVLPLFGEGAALAAAGISVLFPPAAVVVVGLLAWLLTGSRRREERKYAGLRILR